MKLKCNYKNVLLTLSLAHCHQKTHRQYVPDHIPEEKKKIRCRKRFISQWKVNIF